MMEKKYYEMLKKVKELRQKFRKANLSDIGCYELAVDDLVKVYSYAEVSISHIKLLFKPIDKEKSLSRAYSYYNFELLHSRISELVLLLEKAISLQISNKQILWVVNALLDYYENYLITCWYALWEYCIESENMQVGLYQACEEIRKEIEFIVSTHLELYFEEKISNVQVRERIYQQIQLIDKTIFTIGGIEKLSFRLFREFDNRIKCCSEIAYDLYAIRAERLHVDNFILPLYGASLLAMYSKPIMNYFKVGDRIDCLFVRVGFHDLSSLKLSIDRIVENQDRIIPRVLCDSFQKKIQDKLTLIIDDNVGYGYTTMYCKKMVEEYGGKCITRTAETSWQIMLGDNVRLSIDYPSINNYLRYEHQKQYIEGLKKPTSFCRGMESNNESSIVSEKDLLNIELNAQQFKRMHREYRIKEKYELIDFSKTHTIKGEVNRVNIDILDGKCTADTNLNIDYAISRCLDDGLQVCIVDLNKSMFGKNSNDIISYIKNFRNKIWIAGGISSLQEIDTLLNYGAQGVVVGSLLYENSFFDIEMIRKTINWFGTERVMFATDYSGVRIVSKGFRKKTRFMIDEVLLQIDSVGNRISVILTDVNASTYKSAVDFKKIFHRKEIFSNIGFNYGGNISNWKQVIDLNSKGIGAIFGKNYLENNLQFGG